MSFAAGFQLGNRMVAEFDEAKRQKVLDERAAKEFARHEQQWAREDADRARVDQAFSSYEDLQNSGQAVGTNTSGFSDPSARMLYGQGGQQAVDDAASYANAENARFGLPLANRTSLAASPDAAPAPTVQMRKATELDRVGALEKLAVARRDIGAMERLGTLRKSAEDEQLFTQAMKEYTGSDEQIGGTASYLNTNSKRITMGTPDKDGFVQLSVVRPDGRAEFMNLTRQDQAKLYAAGRMMESNPMRAMEIMSSVNKELAAAVAQENGLINTVATSANSVADKRGGLEVQRFNADSTRMNAETNAAYRRMVGEAALQRASGSGGGKPVKMDVDTLDPVTGKKTKVQVLMNPATGEAVTADGRPFKDSAAIDRALGRMNDEDRAAGWEASERKRIDGLIEKGVLPLDQREAQFAKISQQREKMLASKNFAQLDPEEQTTTLRQLVATGQPIAAIADLVGVPVETVKQVAKDVKKPGGMPERIMSQARGNTAQVDTPEGAQLDAARAAVAELRKKAPGLKVGMAAREEFAATLKQAQDEVRRAEQQYQRSLGSGTGPYLGLGANSR